MSGSFTLYEHEDFGGRSFTFRLGDHPESGLVSLDGFRLHDTVSSVGWELPSDTLVALHEHRDGTGRTLSLRPGVGSFARLDDVGLDDRVSTWRWTHVASGRSVPQAFEWVSTTPVAATFDVGGARLVGGHLQGLGMIDARTALISASGDSEAKLFVVRWPRLLAEGRGEIIGEYVIGEPPLTHAGGLQLADGVAAVGVEDDDARDGSIIRFFELAEPTRLAPLDHLRFERPGPGQAPQRERWTAGAVGLARVGRHHLLVVGSWDSAELDVYRSTRSDLRDPRCRFRLVADWSREGADTSTWIDDNWSTYQSLNLLVDGSRVHLVGGSNGRRRTEWIDLYELDLAASRPRRVRKRAKRRLDGVGGASFRWAGGVSAGTSAIDAFSTSRDFDTTPVINAYPGPDAVLDREHVTRYLANTRTREVHSLLEPCRWTTRIAVDNRRPVDVVPARYRRCGHCFPDDGDG